MMKTWATRIFLVAVLASLPCGALAQASSEVQAVTNLFYSLTGVGPSEQEREQTLTVYRRQGPRAAAQWIIDHKEEFYSVTLKNLFTPWTNKDGTVMAPLNDMSLLLIGTVRDDIPFDQAFYKDIYYEAMGDLLTNPNHPDPQKRGNGDRIYIESIGQSILTPQKGENRHFYSIEAKGIDLTDKQVIKRTGQVNAESLHEMPDAVAGVFSTRAFGESYYLDGTNRAPVAFSMKHFFCKEMEDLHDSSTPDFRNRRDVDRAPGGKTETYETLCIGCHAGMDALAGAFAYYDFDEGVVNYRKHEIINEEGEREVMQIPPKMNHNAIFSDGFITQSDSWINLWTVGRNKDLGWPSDLTSGNGAKSFGRMLTKTRQFSQCMARQVYESTCRRRPSSGKDLRAVEILSKIFRQSGYDMKRLFVNSAVSCRGGQS